MLIRHGLRWRDIGEPQLLWSDVLALVETMDYDDPLMKALRGKEWFYYHPLVDHVIGIFDVLNVLTAVVSRRRGIKRTEIPKPTVRPWDKKKDVEVLKVKPSPISNIRKLLGWD